MNTSPEKARDLSFLNAAIPAEQYVTLTTCGDTYWSTNDSSIEEYSKARFPGYSGGLLEVLDIHIGRDADSNVGMDVAGGSQGRALRDLFRLGFLGSGLVTNYWDMREEETCADTSLSHVAGDLATAAVWRKILEWQQQQAPDGLAVVMHRPYGALQDQPPSVYEGAAHLLLDMIRSGGVFFTQVPRPLGKNAEAGRAVYRSIYSRPDVAKILRADALTDHGVSLSYAVVIKQ